MFSPQLGFSRSELLGDIGGEESRGKPVELTMPRHELRRVLIRYRDEGVQQLASEEREEVEARTEAQPYRDAAAGTVRMCNRVLNELTAGG